MNATESGLEIEKEQFLFFREAVCWIAFGGYDFPPIGPRDYHDYLISDAMFEPEIQSNQGRFELAHDQLEAVIAHGKIKVFGRLPRAEHIHTDEAGKSGVSHSIQMPALTVDMVKNLEIYEDDGGYYVGDKFYEVLIVSVRELEQCFTPFAQFIEQERSVEKVPTNSTQEYDFSSVKKRGRPRLHDWDWAMQEIVLLANEPDGLPATQTELESFIAQKFVNRFGQQPADSLIRKKIGPIYQRLRSKSQ